MTPEECRAARDLLGWTWADLAWNAALSETTLRLMEAGTQPLPDPALATVYRVFRAAGIEFSSDGDHGPKVRLRGEPSRRP